MLGESDKERGGQTQHQTGGGEDAFGLVHGGAPFQWKDCCNNNSSVCAIIV